MQGKTAETTDLNAIALRQGVAHDLQHLFERQLNILGRQMLLLGGDDFDQL